MYEFVRRGESLLDIGIGTGLSAVLFSMAGLRVYGMDLSSEMLAVCARKEFAEDLKVHDLRVTPYPFGATSMDHAVCVGVLNHFEDLKPVFSEVSRILKDDGLFGFVVMDRADRQSSRFKVRHADTQVTMYRHGPEELQPLLSRAGMSVLRQAVFLMAEDHEHGHSLRLKAFVARKGEAVDAQ
jgi:predicted TPR repeat methyltransferase